MSETTGFQLGPALVARLRPRAPTPMKASSGSALCPTRIARLTTLPCTQCARPVVRIDPGLPQSIYKLQAETGHVTITALAHDLSVSPASASAMVKKLNALEFLSHERYRGAQLTPGRGARSAGGDPPPSPARALPRRDARPATSTTSTTRPTGSARHLGGVGGTHRPGAGFPTHDPHGDPIPDANLHSGRRGSRPSAVSGPVEGSGGTGRFPQLSSPSPAICRRRSAPAARALFAPERQRRPVRASVPLR